MKKTDHTTDEAVETLVLIECESTLFMDVICLGSMDEHRPEVYQCDNCQEIVN